MKFCAEYLQRMDKNLQTSIVRLEEEETPLTSTVAAVESSQEKTDKPSLNSALIRKI